MLRSGGSHEPHGGKTKLTFYMSHSLRMTVMPQIDQYMNIMNIKTKCKGQKLQVKPTIIYGCDTQISIVVAFMVEYNTNVL